MMSIIVLLTPIKFESSYIMQLYFNTVGFFQFLLYNLHVFQRLATLDGFGDYFHIRYISEYFIDNLKMYFCCRVQFLLYGMHNFRVDIKIQTILFTVPN